MLKPVFLNTTVPPRLDVCWLVLVFICVLPRRSYRNTMPYEFSMQELQDLIDGLPPMLYAREHPRVRVRLLGLKSIGWTLQQRKRYRRFRCR